MPGVGSLNGPGLIADVRKTVPPHTIGEDHPRPGTSATQATFSLGDQDVGVFVSRETPAASGPRNCGQRSLAPTAPASAVPRRSAITTFEAVAGRRFMGGVHSLV